MVKPANLNIPVPILGPRPDRTKAGVSIIAMARELDANGHFEVDVVAGPNGQPQPRFDRSAYVSAEELVEMVREAVREEVRAAVKSLIQRGVVEV